MKLTHTAFLLCGTLTLAACSDGGGGNTPPENLPPTLSAIGDANLPANSPEARISFSVSDDMTAAGDINVSVETDAPDLFAGSGIAVAGGGEDRELVFTPVTGVVGMARVTLTARDTAGQTSSESFLLSLTPQQLAFDTALRAAFAADENDEPITLNDKELDQNEQSYDDLLRD